MTQIEYESYLARAYIGGLERRETERIAAGREDTLHAGIIDHCKRKGWIYLRSRMDIHTGRMPGEPDFSILADGGRRFDIECKTEKEKPSSEQLGFISWAQRLGHRVHVVRSMGEFLEVVK